MREKCKKQPSVNSHQLTAITKIVFLFFVVFFSGCENSDQKKTVLEDQCLPSAEIQIIATLPGGKVDLSEPEIFQESSEKKSLQSFGIYVEKNLVLTVAHAIPKGASAQGLSRKKEDAENELLLLSSKICGAPVSVSSKNPVEEEALFFCGSGAVAGKVEEADLTSYSKKPFSDSTKSLEGLVKISGKYSLGDSGRGFCNKKGELAGILVAVTEKDEGLLIPSNQVLEFLN